MPSPDTDELATVPLPSGAPEAETREPRSGSRTAAEARTAEREHATSEVAPAEAEPERIDPDSAVDVPAAPAKDRGRWWRGFTGSLAAGLTVLAIGVLVVAGVCLYTGAPGPGAALLIGHPVAAALALLAQRVADRRTGPASAGAGVAVVLFTASALTIFWLT